MLLLKLILKKDFSDFVDESAAANLLRSKLISVTSLCGHDRVYQSQDLTVFPSESGKSFFSASINWIQRM